MTCTSKNDATPTVDLIGCRIKVWWPMDKKFYGGVVKSFDTQKSKHVVLYDDGDVEVLRLERSVGSLLVVSRSLRRVQIPKRFQAMRKHLERGKIRLLLPPGKRKGQIKMPPLSQVRGKRTPRKNLKYGQKGPSKSSLSRRSLLLGKPLATSKSKAADDLSSGESESEQNESTHGSLSEHELSDKDDISYSDGTPGADADRSSGMEESEEEECPLENKEFKDEPGTPQDSRGSDEDISSSHEKPHADVSTVKSNDDAERSDSHGSVGGDADSHSTDQSDTGSSSAAKSDEWSDDELLSTWKQRAGKLAGGK